MKKVLIISIIIFSVSVANADSFYKLVGYECGEKANSIKISYLGAYNEAGKEMIKNKGPRQWDPWELIESMKDDDHIGSLKTVKRKCKLKDGIYTITIGPVPGNFNIQGRCGAFMSAWAEVRKGSKVILPQYVFEADCHNTEIPVTTEIVIKAGCKKHHFTKVAWDEFYK
ncbi:MAG: hypothetical protein PHN98_07530 [Smithellaceae bacterium]|nr:hypothetical protein [Smithellaceae bacterium]